MCKMADHGGVCTELGSDSKFWSTKTPLPKPEWMKVSLQSFQEALSFQIEGKRTEAINAVEQIEDDRLRDWFVNHAQNLGGIRFKGLGSKKLTRDIPTLDSTNKFAKFVEQIFKDDAYTCVYCKWPVFLKEDFVNLAAFLNLDSFILGAGNATRPGIFLVFCGTLDHVIPFKKGGRTDPTNLVTCCWPCNYEKTISFWKRLG